MIAYLSGETPRSVHRRASFPLFLADPPRVGSTPRNMIDRRPKDGWPDEYG